jgi:hypothetical protein
MRPVAEECIALDVAEVTGGPRVGRLTWSNAAPGFHVVYEVRPGEVILRFPNGAVQTIGLWREEIHNGGHRTWFYLDGRRAMRLWLAPDETLVQGSRVPGSGVRLPAHGKAGPRETAGRADRGTAGAAGVRRSPPEADGAAVVGVAGDAGAAGDHPDRDRPPCPVTCIHFNDRASAGQKSSARAFAIASSRCVRSGFTGGRIGPVHGGSGNPGHVAAGSPTCCATACGYALANAGQDTRSIQAYLGHRHIGHTVRYTELAPDRFRNFWRD